MEAGHTCPQLQKEVTGKYGMNYETAETGFCRQANRGETKVHNSLHPINMA
jgi:hypothetical protein